MPTVRLTINGVARAVETDPRTPLLWVLRDALGLTGTKYGCGIAQCGACTVHLDDAPVRACATTVGSAAGRRITTIEGLASGRHPSTAEPGALQQAWLAEQVPQCGYCQSGMLMAAAALLAERPRPTDADIDTALGGHICRCGTYGRIRRAIHRAAGAAGEAAPGRTADGEAAAAAAHGMMPGMAPRTSGGTGDGTLASAAVPGHEAGGAR